MFSSLCIICAALHIQKWKFRRIMLLNLHSAKLAIPSCRDRTWELHRIGCDTRESTYTNISLRKSVSSWSGVFFKGADAGLGWLVCG